MILGESLEDRPPLSVTPFTIKWGPLKRSNFGTVALRHVMRGNSLMPSVYCLTDLKTLGVMRGSYGSATKRVFFLFYFFAIADLRILAVEIMHCKIFSLRQTL